MKWRIPIAKPDLPLFGDYAACVAEIWNTRRLSNFGPFVERLESIASEYLGAPCLAVSSGDVGLICAVAALELPRGSRVLVPSFTFQSTINAVLWNGHVPVFVDVERETLCMDMDEAISSSIDGLDAVVSTDCFGSPATQDAWFGNVPVVHDAAHSYGARIKDGRETTARGAASVFSLSGTKVVTSGEGGLVASRDPAFLERVRLLRGYGFSGDYNASRVGINGKMSELHAALGCLTLPTVDGIVTTRTWCAAAYVEWLKDLPVSFQRVPDGCRSTWKDFAVLFADHVSMLRAARALSDAGIECKRYFRPLHHQPAYRAFATRPLPVTDDVYERVLCLPIFASISAAEVSEVCGVVTRAVRG